MESNQLNDDDDDNAVTNSDSKHVSQWTDTYSTTSH